MVKIPSIVSLLIGLTALVKSVLERRGPNRLPILVLFRDRFPDFQLKWIVAALGAGSFVVVGPLNLSNVLGWVHLKISGGILDAVSLLGLMTVSITIVWATIEELIFRGAILPQTSKLTNGWWY